MEVFHWVANQLKDVPLFSSQLELESERVGAVYNDFDQDQPFGPDDDLDLNFSFTQSENNTINDEERRIENQTEMMNTEEHTVFFDLENFDCTSYYPDNLYRKKVYDLLTTEVHCVILTEDDLSLYNKRMETDWKGPDTVYDLWLIGQCKERTWFPLKQFAEEYPDYKEIVGKIGDEEQAKKDKSEQKRNKKRRRVRIESDSEEDQTFVNRNNCQDEYEVSQSSELSQTESESFE